jgi:hypothetical protein
MSGRRSNRHMGAGTVKKTAKASIISHYAALITLSGTYTPPSINLEIIYLSLAIMIVSPMYFDFNFSLLSSCTADRLWSSFARITKI